MQLAMTATKKQDVTRDDMVRGGMSDRRKDESEKLLREVEVCMKMFVTELNS